MIRRIIRQSIFISLPLTVLTIFADLKIENLTFVKRLGNPYLTPSLIIGIVLGIANIRGLVWGVESLLGTYKASSKLVFLSILRLLLLFAIIIILAIFRLINFLGLLTGMTVPFVLLVKEGLRLAKEQSEKDGP